MSAERRLRPHPQPPRPPPRPPHPPLPRPHGSAQVQLSQAQRLCGRCVLALWNSPTHAMLTQEKAFQAHDAVVGVRRRDVRHLRDRGDDRLEPRSLGIRLVAHDVVAVRNHLGLPIHIKAVCPEALAIGVL